MAFDAQARPVRRHARGVDRLDLRAERVALMLGPNSALAIAGYVRKPAAARTRDHRRICTEVTAARDAAGKPARRLPGLVIADGNEPQAGVAPPPGSGNRSEMKSRLSFGRRLATALTWPVGIALTSWHYMWRTTPMHRSEVVGDGSDLPPPLPDCLRRDDLQLPSTGVGPLFHRRFEVRIRQSRLTPEVLIDLLSRNPNRASPTEFARFHKFDGGSGPLQVESRRDRLPRRILTDTNRDAVVARGRGASHPSATASAPQRPTKSARRSAFPRSS